MQAVHGYFDGTTVRPLEKIDAKPNQRVIITVMDEFLPEKGTSAGKNLRGILSKYADPELAKKEDGAWERAVKEKHGAV